MHNLGRNSTVTADVDGSAGTLPQCTPTSVAAGIIQHVDAQPLDCHTGVLLALAPPLVPGAAEI